MCTIHAPGLAFVQDFVSIFFNENENIFLTMHQTLCILGREQIKFSKCSYPGSFVLCLGLFSLRSLSQISYVWHFMTNIFVIAPFLNFNNNGTIRRVLTIVINNWPLNILGYQLVRIGWVGVLIGVSPHNLSLHGNCLRSAVVGMKISEICIIVKINQL